MVLDCEDPERLAAFWSAVLDYIELGREPAGGIEIGPASGFGGLQPTLILSPSTDPKPGKLPLHIEVNATDRDQDAELERLLALGARPADVGQTGDENWPVLQDPEGITPTSAS
ncbi:VOC family protein [Kribbella sp. NBC_01484]